MKENLPYDSDMAADEAQDLTNRLKQFHSEQGTSFSRQQYAREHEILEIEKYPHPSLGKQEGPFILTPELKKEILEKVRDVASYGTAYTWILDAEPKVLDNVFQIGILGIPRENRPRAEGPDVAEQKLGFFKEGLRAGKQTTVSFNIVGRSFTERMFREVLTGRNGKPPVGPKAYEKEKGRIIAEGVGSGAGPGVAIVFDVSQFTETPPQTDTSTDLEGNSTWREQRDIGTYAIRNPGGNTYIDPTPNEHGDLVTTVEYGFSLYSRLAPEKFTGVVVSDRKAIDKVLSVWSAHPDEALPIYDIQGNLLWPESLKNEEIKKSLD